MSKNNLEPVTGTAAAREEADHAADRAVVYSFIASVLETVVPVPGGDYVSSLIGMISPAANGGEGTPAGDAIKAAAGAVAANATAEQLAFARDRTKFVRGAKGAKGEASVKPPFEALYRTSNDSLETIAAIAGVYSEAGYVLNPDMNNRPDSLAAECLFMQQLCSEQADAAAKGDILATAMAVNAQQAFFSQHLGAWVPDYCEQVIAAAQSSMFRAFAAFTREFLEDEAASFAA